MSGIQALLDVARSQLGVHEDPPYSNRVKYSAWYGMVGPWCDMFVSWCADQSGNRDVIGRFAYTPSHEAWFRSKGREVSIRDAKPGDIVFFNFIGRTSHVGIVEANRGDGLITIEGNTNGAGSRDGGSVMRHFRSWSSGIVSVHRPAYSNTSEEGEFVMDKEAAAQFFKQAVLMLQIEQRQIEREIAAEKREHDRDKRRWTRLWKILDRDNNATDVDEVVDTAKEELLGQVKAQIAEFQAKIDALS